MRKSSFASLLIYSDVLENIRIDTAEELRHFSRLKRSHATSLMIDTTTFSLSVRDAIELRFIRPGEAETLYKLVDQNRAYLRQWLPWVDAQTSPESSRKNILERIEKAQNGTALGLGIYLNGKLSGSMGFNRIVSSQKKASIGYWISPEFQGEGIVTDCVRALITYGFQELGLHRIRIQCSVNNKRSAAIPERLGFTFEGIAREDEFLYDHFEDSKVYSILEREWRK